MAIKCEEAQELISALVDDELLGSERASIDEHLKGCSSCQLVYSREQALKREVHRAGVALRAPVVLREKILSDPATFLKRPMHVKESGWGVGLSFRPALALAVVVLLLVPVFYMMRPADEPPSLSAFEIHEKISSGQLSFVRGGSPEEIKQRLYRSVAGTFAPMRYDLSRINLTAVAGTVQEVDGRKVLVTIYEGGGASLTCYTFLGTETDVPAAAQLFYDAEKKINFYSYSRGAMNAVLHLDGNLICILVSTLPAPKLLALARSTV